MTNLESSFTLNILSLVDRLSREEWVQDFFSSMQVIACDSLPLAKHLWNYMPKTLELSTWLCYRWGRLGLSLHRSSGTGCNKGVRRARHSCMCVAGTYFVGRGDSQRPKSACLLRRADDYVRCPRNGCCWEIIHKYEYLITPDGYYFHAFKGFRALCDTCRFNHKWGRLRKGL